MLSNLGIVMGCLVAGFGWISLAKLVTSSAATRILLAERCDITDGPRARFRHLISDSSSKARASLLRPPRPGAPLRFAAGLS